MVVLILVIIIALLLYLVLTTPLTVAAFVYAGILNETAVFSLRLERLTLMAAKLEFAGDDLMLTNRKGRQKRIMINPHINTRIPKLFLHILHEKKLALSFYGGVAGDEYHSSMLCGGFASAVAAAAPYASSGGIEISTSIIKTQTDNLTLSGYFSARTTIARVLIALIFKR